MGEPDCMLFLLAEAIAQTPIFIIRRDWIQRLLLVFSIQFSLRVMIVYDKAYLFCLEIE
jgi:hypothetical protein